MATYSTDNNNQNNAPIIIDPRILTSSNAPDDEIDLFELFSNIWSQKFLIICITVIAITIGGLYAFLSKPVYESELYLLPPTAYDTEELRKLSEYTKAKTDKSITTDYSTTYVFEKFSEILNSNQAKRSFFLQPEINKYYVKNNTQTRAWKNFLEDLTIHPGDKKKDDKTVKVTFKSESPQNSAQWLNKYLNHVISIAKDQLVDDVRKEINSQREQIDLQITSKTKLYSSDLEKELTKLREALSIAEALGQSRPLNTDSIDNERSNLMIDEVRRLYKLGSTVLKAEISALENRKNHELFIPGLSDLLLSKTNLASLTIDKSHIQPVKIDLEAQIPEKPIKPKKALILAISFVLGIMMGLFTAIIRSAIKKRSEAKD